ncbi:MAG: hypothetical protein HFF21_03065 [Oscillospiraceae bacterium]|jgi:hypothetical protein|nr:hypothetical protein [Oscillospiraceae bacterium]
MMQDNKKAARGATNTTDSRVETGPASQAVPHLHQQSTTPAPLGQAVKIADFLSRGETNALPLRHLRDLLHLPARTIRLIIRAERMSGTPILESSKADGGYYLPGNDHERARCVQRLRRRAAEIVKVANAIEEADI